jgi:hypothetical protein
MLHWLSHFFGLDNLSGPFYGFWSGVGSDIGEVTIIGGLVTIGRHKNCHVKGCWRIGRHHHGPYLLCSKHHPLVPDEITEEAVSDV